MDFHPPFIIFCALGACVMIISALLAVAAEKMDDLLTRQTAVMMARRPIVHRHAETSHIV